MSSLPWIAALVCAVAAGAASAATLIVPRDRLFWAGAATAVTTAATVVALSSIAAASGRVDTSVAALFIALGATLGGFALFASLIQGVLLRRAAPRPPRPGAPDGRCHVLVLADAEPEAYSPGGIAEALADLEDSEVSVPPDAARLLVYASERTRFARLGGSPARGGVRAIALALAAELHDEGIGPVSACFCSGESDLSAALADSVRQGARRIVVAVCEAAESRAASRARAAADDLDLAALGVSVTYTDPLWSSHRLAHALASRALEALETTAPHDGVVLVAEGRPWQWARSHPAEAEHTTYLLQRVRAELVRAGLLGEHVRTAWLEWDEPDVPEVLRHLVALGCRRICVLPAAMPSETVETMLDLRAAARDAARDEGVETLVLPAWGDDPALIAELAERVRTALAGQEDATPCSAPSSPTGGA